MGVSCPRNNSKALPGCLRYVAIMTITPDTKDWTWVLERRCPDCGYDAGAVDGTQVATRLRDVATRWQEVIARPNAGARPAPDVWSPLEYSCHVGDTCVRFRGRLEQMLNEEDPLFENWDQDATAIERRYDQLPREQVADEFGTAASAMAARLDAVSGSQWQRPGRRSDGSSFTVESLSQYFLHDLVHHLWDVRAPDQA
jgi:hypothetical protein